MLTDALLLPALSSVSTRDEMQPLADQLADRLRSVIADWRCFGARRRGTAPVSPAALRAFILIAPRWRGPFPG